MCGLIGIVNGGGLDDKRFRTSLDVMKHRGPEVSTVKDFGKSAFGFCRLAIQDLSSDGNQPMSDVNGQSWIIFNGEIYNFRELKNDLEMTGYKFASRSDTEVILQGYLTWGWERLLAKLEGMFAFAIYDEVKSKIFVVRDQMGIKPLFYSTIDKGLIFASEIKAILEYTGPKPLDRSTSLNPILTTGVCPTGTTMFQGVNELEAGTYLEYDLETDKFRIHRYFDIVDLVSKDLFREMSTMSSNQLIDRHCETLRDSVSSHLISDAKLGVMFSGGLDSSLVAAIASQLSTSDLSLYYFLSTHYDDIKYSNAFKKRFSSDLKTFQYDEDEVIFDLPRMVYNYETINKEEGTVLGKLCREARQDGCKVLLAGDGSDEVFGGYSTHWSFYTRSTLHSNPLFKLAFRTLRRMLPGLERSGDFPRGTDYYMNPADMGLLEVPMNILFHKGTRLDDWQRRLSAYDFLPKIAERDTAAHLLDNLTYHLQRYLVRADRIGMMESVELRVPYVHLPLLRLAVNTPIKWRIGRSLFDRRPDFMTIYNGKRVVRKMAKRFQVPNDIIYRKKLGTPFAGQRQVNDLIERFSLQNVAEFFDVTEGTLRKTLLESFDPYGDRIRWSVLSAEILIREFVHRDDHHDISDEFRTLLKR